jgi:hypothetical protein
MRRIARGVLPARRNADTISMGLYHRALVLLSMPIDEASAKVRAGPPIDDEADYGWPVWAGTLSFRTIVDPPEPCPRLDPAVKAPAHVAGFRLK